MRLCWDEGKGLVADTKAKAHFSQQANILAVLADALPAGRRASVLDKVLAEPMLSSADGVRPPAEGAAVGKGLGLAKASYYFRFYLARALEATGRGDEYLPQPSLFTSRRAPNREQELEAKVAGLEAKLIRKDAIIAEVSEEYVKLKRELGEL